MFAHQLDTPLVTEAEYLAYEAAAEFRNEFHDGQILAMSGGTRAHVLISSNTHNILNSQLARRRCDVYTSDMKVRTGTGNHYYPDVSALCGTPEFTADTPPSLLNPTLIVEVLSDSTEVFDRDLKFRRYKTIPSFQVYLIIAQHEVLVDMFTLLPDGDWKQHTATTLDAVIDIPLLDVRLALRDIYFNTLYNPDDDQE